MILGNFLGNMARGEKFFFEGGIFFGGGHISCYTGVSCNSIWIHVNKSGCQLEVKKSVFN